MTRRYDPVGSSCIGVGLNGSVSMGATAAAVAILRKQEDLVEHFRSAGATSEGDAKSVDELGVDTGMVWQGMLRGAVVREASAGRFYLDEPSWAAKLGRRRLRTWVLVGVVLAMVAWVILRTSSGGPPLPAV